MMILRPEQGKADITVELDDDYQSTVRLVLEPQTGETFDDCPITRDLLPAEARELAAMLFHKARQAERFR